MAAEKQFENKIKKYLDNIGSWYIKYWGGGEFTKAGIPDILCCVNGYFVAIEVKASNGKPSNLQLAKMIKIRKSGAISIVLYPNKFDGFKRLCSLLLDGDYEGAKEIQTNFDDKIKKQLDGVLKEFNKIEKKV